MACIGKPRREPVCLRLRKGGGEGVTLPSLCSSKTCSGTPQPPQTLIPCGPIKHARQFYTQVHKAPLAAHLGTQGTPVTTLSTQGKPSTLNPINPVSKEARGWLDHQNSPPRPPPPPLPPKNLRTKSPGLLRPKSRV